MITVQEGLLLEQLIAQGIGYWTSLQARKAAGMVTSADVAEALSKLDRDLSQLEQDVDAQAEYTKADVDFRASGG